MDLKKSVGKIDNMEHHEASTSKRVILVDSAGNPYTASGAGTSAVNVIEEVEYDLEEEDFDEITAIAYDWKLHSIKILFEGAGYWFRPPQMTTTERNTMTSSWGVSDAGKMWFNTTSNQWEGWDGTTAVIIG